ncbi:amino acid adenylation domain-containing protein [Pseudomonas sp. NPDC089406]|uniref:amino acid adenylation domain-containing protein n=1 Tax=Pseudomonas sp. NPDC089406 TaxID=3364463 RepID=UPI00384A5F13
MDNAQMVQRFLRLPSAQRRLFLEKLAEKGMSLANLPIPVSRHEQDSLPLSYAQQRQWFLWQLEPGSSAYHIPAALHLRGPLDSQALQGALDALVARHESLRTCFDDEPQAQQRILAQGAVALELQQAPEGLDAQARTALIERFVDATLATPFDLRQGPLLRARLLQLGEHDQVLVLALHHIVADGWSMQVLVRELVALYQGQGAALAPLPIQYADYALWQRCWMEAGERERQLAYWTAQLAGEQPLLELPHDRPRPAVASQLGARCDVALPAELLPALRQACQREGVTLFMLLLASFQWLLQRYSGQADIRVGVPVGNRNRAETQGLIGFFVNTQVLRAQFAPRDTLASLLAQVREAALQAQTYQDLPYEQLVEALQPERNLSYNPLFQVMFNHQVQGRQEQAPTLAGGLRVEALAWERHASPFDLNLDTYEDDQRLWASFTYATELFDPATVQGIAGHWQQLLHAFTGDLSQPLEEAASAALPGAAPSQCAAPLLLEALAASVAANPAAPAVRQGSQCLDYAQLDACANRLAHQLRAAGVGAESLVGLALARSPQLVIAQLAVLKAGGAYVPLDPDYPRERLAYMVEDSGLALLLSSAEVSLRTGPLPAPQVLLLDADTCQPPAENPGAPALQLHAEQLAYVIYTSGSTGRPKGVAIRHGGLANHMQWMRASYPLGADDRVLQKTAFSFDASVWEFWLPLMCGAQLVLAPADLNDDLGQLWPLVAGERISVLQVAPSLLQGLLPQLQSGQLASLRLLLAGGEALKGSLLRQLREHWQGRVVNLYGPTESTIDSTWHEPGAAFAGDVVPIGAPIAGVSSVVLADSLRQCPVDAAGELYLGGASLARGYHRRPGLTAERFVPDPGGAPGARLYRSGDRVRLRSDGLLHYLGRIDHQLKLRGLRIELGEIEAALLDQPGVREAVVLPVDGPRGTQLVAYLVTAEQQQLEPLREALAARLPAYMLPVHWLALPSLPLTVNGKLDRAALPRPDADQAADTFQAPQGPMERALAEVWQDVLKVAQVGRQDNFFELGGDSIISLQVVSRARLAGIRFTPKALFQHQTVQALAQVAQRGDSEVLAEQGLVDGELPLLPIQQAFFETPMSARHHWNQSVLLEPREVLDANALEQALQGLLRQHDALRLRFEQQGGAWQAWHAPHDDRQALLWQRQVLDAEALLAVCEQAQRSLDLAHGPLLRAVLFDYQGAQRLLLVAHHLVVDGVSWRILFEDLQALYQAPAAALPAKTSALRDWARRLHQQADSLALQPAADYWLEQARQAMPALPCANPEGSLHRRYARHATSRLDQALTRALLQQAPSAYRTQVNDLLLTALARVFCAWSGQPALWVQLEGHGREELFDDIDLTRTVGWFTSAYPVCLRPAEGLAESLKAVKEQLRAIPDKGVGFGVLRSAANPRLAPLRALATPQVTFNYLGQFDGSFDDAQALFVPAREAAGSEQGDDAPLASAISINGQVYQGELVLEWTFSEQQFAPATLQRLADDYARALAELVEHCLAPGAGGVTPSDVPLAGLDQARLDSLPVPAANLADAYPLSPMQQGMLFHGLYSETRGDYINQLQVQIDGLDPQRFQQAWQATLDAHDSLRCQFHWPADQAQPLQLVLREVALPFAEVDLRSVSDAPQALHALAAEARDSGFVLHQAPLLRVQLARCAEQRYQMIFTSHHLLMDGWSNAQLLAEVLQRYAGQAPAAPAGRFRDYIGWLQGRDALAAEQFWKGQLQHFDGPTLLAQAIARGPLAPASGQLRVTLGQAVTQALQGFARAAKVTLNTLVQGAWTCLLQRHTGQAQVTFGATVSGRPAELPGIEQQIGLFINSLPVIAGAIPEQALVPWLQGLQGLNLQLRDWEHTPLYDIQRWAGHSGEALFDSLLVFENYPVAEALEQGAPAGLRFGEVLGHEQTGFPLSVLVDAGQDLAVTFKYDPARFDAAAIQGLGQQLLALLRSMASLDGQARVADLRPFDAAQGEAWLALGQGPQADYPRQPSVPRLIEAQAKRTPQAAALTFAGVTLSYAELEARSNQLAHRLVAAGVGPDVLVGVAAQRSLEMVIALLAVLKAGGAYVPLDPDYPAERLAYLFEDSGIALLLSQSWLLDALPGSGALPTLALDTLAWDDADPGRPAVEVDGEHLAYVLYTSGSTGKPKGAGNRHRALVNRLLWMQQAYGLQAHDVVLQKTPFSFDVSVWEFFWPLLAGAHLVVAAPGDHRDPARLVALIREAQVSTLHFVPSMLQVFLQDPQVSACASLRRIVCSGEALPADAQQQVFARLPGAQLYNLYGPTEAAIDVTHWHCIDDGRATVPIGSAIANLRTYILDHDLQPVGPGVTGELYLAGEGLARGYHRRPGLTAERFPLDPFVAGERMYRTGDLARYDQQGAIEYAGRIDHQVKVRGLRIELGEIEARLLEHGLVREAVVTAPDAGKGPQLVAYLVADDGLDPAQLRDFLRQGLPEHMVPAHLVTLAQMPLSANGKLDRRQLPGLDSLQAQVAYRAPQSELQQQVAQVWGELLALEQVGLDDAFFALGGHSLLAAQAVMRLREQLQLEVPVRLLFETASLEAFCAEVQALSQDQAPVQDELTKSLEALKRLSAEELEKLLS